MRGSARNRARNAGIGDSGERPMDPAVYRSYWITSQLNHKQARLMREMHDAGYHVRYLQKVFGIRDWRMANMICKQDW